MERARAVPQYIALGVLFLTACAYQMRAIQERFPQWFGPEQPPAWPFLITPDSQAPRFQIHFLPPDATRAGLHSGDILLAINGRSVSGSAVFGRAISRARIGDLVKVAVQSRGETFSATVTLTAANQQLLGSVSVIGAAVISSFCVLLGFWVAAIRPRDRLAWLLLAFLLGFTTFFNSFPEGWGPITRDLGSLYQAAFNASWGVWLLLFAVYFPEPMAPGSNGRRFWQWFTWVVVAPTAMKTVLSVITSIGALEDYASVFWAARFATFLHPLFTITSVAAELGFLACLAWKWRLPATPDARRRLRVVSLAAYISYPLLLACNLIAIVRHSQIEELFPSWLYNTAYLLEFLFPLAVAYAIVVQRAMDVRLIVRQSLQYTLARRGVIILQVVLSAVLFALLAALVTSQAMSYSHTVLFMAAGLWGIFLLNGVTHRVAALVDRRFFREAYSSEQILGELAEEVRMIVGTRPLLETVSERIGRALHVTRMAVLLNGSGPYRPAFAAGYPAEPAIAFADSAGVVERLKGERQPLRVYFDDPESWLFGPSVSSQERAELAALQPELLLPLLVKDDLIGFMALGQKRSEAPYSGSDLRLLSSVATQTSLSLEVSRLTETVSREASQRERLNRELEIAREVQEKLFPSQLPTIAGLDYSADCRPAREVGGDYYDFIQLPEDRFAIAIGDISGKGIGAALMMANLQASLRGQVAAIRDMPELMGKVNAMVYSASSANRYATFFYSEYEPLTRRLAYVNAGHNPPIILRKAEAGEQVLRCEIGGPVIGLLPQAAYEQGSLELISGDTFVLFTDGVSESMNMQEEEWGEERLIACARVCDGLSARKSLARIFDEAVSFAAGAPQHDDMTLIVVRVR